MLCDACQMGKKIRVAFKSKNCVSTSKPIDLLHLDIFGPSMTRSLWGNYYGFVIVDDFTRFTWSLFLSQKEETFEVFVKFVKIIQNELNLKIVTLISGHGGDFVNHQFESFCKENGIAHNFSCSCTPQQNGVVEHKNRVLEELAQTMISEMELHKYFWVNAIKCYFLNRVVIRPILDKTPNELLKDRKYNISYIRNFGCKCFILNDGKYKLGIFDSKAYEGIFLR